MRPTIFAGFGAISFAFVCQHSSFLVYRSMSKRGVERWTYVTKWSVAIALVMGMILALGGYWNFADQTEGNILNNFSTKHKPASVARGFLAVTMVSACASCVPGGMLGGRFGTPPVVSGKKTINQRWNLRILDHRRNSSGL